MKLLLFSILLILLTSGCDPSKSTQPSGNALVPVAKQGLILREFGKLTSNDETLTVIAVRRSISLVDYTITENESDTVLATGGGFSDAQWWFLFFDEKNQLWVYDSDIGTFGYWARLEDSKMEFVKIDKDTPASKVPATVIENIPSTIKRIFGWNIDQDAG